MELALSKPQVGSLVWAKANRIKRPVMFFSSSITQGTEITAMLVTEVLGIKLKGIVFARNLKETVSREFMLAFKFKYKSLNDALELIPGFDIYKGYGSVNNGDINTELGHRDPLSDDPIAREKLFKEFAELQT